ncbi:hypothetical protein [uncultured Aquimarina sp.]|uniref:hypothetical protein n=1 Tax=uncultured Aquimarina sp. TaxID=575652 RepID=UPI002631A600|nr:hypothetical protein [uncultured Aquimarina sp.]
MNFVRKVKEFINKAYQGKITEARDMLHENVLLEMSGNNQLSGKHYGKDVFFENFSKMLALSNGTYKITKEYDWLNGEDKCLLIAEEFIERDGTMYYFDRVIQYDFEKDKISKVRIYEGNPSVVNEAFR